MFDIGFPELLIVGLVLLLVVGPERLPEVLRTVGRVMGSARRSFDTLRSELEREVGADEIRRELHNARIMEDAKRLQEDLKGAESALKSFGQSTRAELTAAEDALRGEVAPPAEAPLAEPSTTTEPCAAEPSATPPQGELALADSMERATETEKKA